MKLAAVGALLVEARNAVKAIQSERHVAKVGPLVVSGMLAEQLARELGDGAAPGSVVVSDSPRVPRAQVAVRVIAGDPNEEDDAFVREAERAEIPVVLVQVWPQADWGAPYVLSPFVVECKTGEGFPIPKIAKQVVRAADHRTALAGGIPVLAPYVTEDVIRGSVLRAALIGFGVGGKSSVRPVIALEQMAMVARLDAVEGKQKPRDDELPVVAGTAAVGIATSFALREVARVARRRLPPRIAESLVAAGATWTIAKLAQTLEARGVL